jgi:hypothetical protein
LDNFNHYPVNKYFDCLIRGRKWTYLIKN